jgi:hypothetical protein
MMTAEQQMERWPPVKSPVLSRWAGLGYGQMQIGQNFLLMAQYDTPRAMASVLSPMLPAWVQRGAVLLATIAPFVMLASVAAATESTAGAADSFLSSSNAGLVVLLAFIVCACCGTLGAC